MLNPGQIIFSQKQQEKQKDHPTNQPKENKTIKENRKPVAEKTREEAHQELQKESAKKEEESNQKLEELVEASQKVLFTVKTNAPLDPFPDEIIIGLDKISVVEREFFMSDIIHTYPIKDIKDAVVSTGPLWSKLDLTIEGYQGGTLSLAGVKTDDAIRARRIIQGLKICEDEGIKLTNLKEEDVVAKIEEIGKAREDNSDTDGS